LSAESRSVATAEAIRARTSFSWRARRHGRRLSFRDFARKGGFPVLKFFNEDEGQGLVEYALIIAVIAIAVIVAMIFLRGQITNIFSNIGNNLT
jgi:pilus assembly protein Flp/PilA